MPIRQSAPSLILKPNAAIKEMQQPDRVQASAPSSMPHNLSHQLQNDMNSLMQVDVRVGQSYNFGQPGHPSQPSALNPTGHSQQLQAGMYQQAM